MLTFRARDRAGNASAGHALTFVVDSQPPEVAVTVRGGTTTREETVTLDIDAFADTGTPLLELRASGSGSVSSLPFGPFAETATVPLADPDTSGSKTVVVEVRDAAGNTTSETIAITLDKDAPSGTLTVQGPWPSMGARPSRRRSSSI